MKRMWTKATVFLASLVALTFLSTSAFALDGYQDRKGVFGGFSAGGGYGFINDDGELLDEGPGLQVQAVIGGGVADWVTVGLQADWWLRTVNKGAGDQYAWHNASVGALGNFFLVDGFRLGAGAGFAYGACSGERNDRSCDWQELGMAAKAGAGYEFWFNGTTAGAIDLGYTHHFYSNSSFDTVSLTFGLRFY